MTGVKFTSAEQMAMWKFVIADHNGYRRYLWELFIEETESQRSASSLYYRFSRVLLPHLPQTKFHVETKLKLCQKYNVEVDEEFLKELETDAEVELNENGTVNSYQLKPNCPKNRDLEMDDEEFMKITSPLTCTPWTSEEITNIWKYFLENDMHYTPGSNSFWTGVIGKLKNRTVYASRMKFRDNLAPNIHLTDFSIETKLKLYKKSQVAVNKKYRETLKEHAELEIDENRCIVDYKIKTGRPEKRKNDNEEDENAKKARRDVPETIDDQEEDEDLVFDNVVPGSSSEVQQEEDDLILDNVADRDWTNPDMMIRRPPKIEVDDDDDPTFHELYDSPVETKQDEDTIMALVEPKREVFEQDRVIFEYNEPAFREVEQEQRRDNQNDSIVQMLDVMKRMEKTIEDQRADFVKDREAAEKRIVELSRVIVAMENQAKKREEAFKRDMSDMKNELEASCDVVSSLHNEIMIIRNEIKNALPEDPAASEKMKYLLILKKLVATRKPSPETEDFGKRIETALQSLPENDESSLPMKAVNGILELAISTIGF